jgi:hypothetical protein
MTRSSNAAAARERRNRLAGQIAALREKLELAYGKAMDNELGDGFGIDEARDRIFERGAGYADSLGIDARLFTAYARERAGRGAR